MLAHGGTILFARYTNILSVSHCEFVGNIANITMGVWDGVTATIDHCKFISNAGSWTIIGLWNQSMISITYSEFINNSVPLNCVIALYGDMITVSLSKFINNRAKIVLYVWKQQPTKADNLANNMFVGNNANI